MRCIPFTVFLILLATSAQAGSDLEKQFRKRYKSKDAEERLSAIDVLAGTDNAEVAEQLLKVIDRDDARRVAVKAGEALGKLRSQEAITYLVERLPSFRADADRIALAIRSAAFIRSERLMPVFQDLPTGTVSKSKISRTVARLDGIAELRKASPEAMEAIRKLTGDQHRFSIRHAAVRALSQIPDKSTVPFLIALSQEGGRIQEAAFRALIVLTGERKGLHPRPWQEWWQGEGAKIELDKDAISRRSFDDTPLAKREKGHTFYGIPLYANKVLFVLDMSGSMAFGRPTTRMDNLKGELTRLINEMDEEKAFNIIFFSGTVEVWRRSKLYKATEKNKYKAVKFISEAKPFGPTETGLAMDLAFEEFVKEDDVETIFLLSDGLPMSPRARETKGMLDTDQICRDIREKNEFAYVRINTVGSFAKGGEGGFKEPNPKQLKAFLKRIADENDGQFAEVE